MLEEEERRWWQSIECSFQRTHQEHENEDEDVSALTWEGFKEAFNDKYFPRSWKEERIWEFMRLKQTDKMLVTQYDT